MSGTTPTYGLPYPTLEDAPNGAAQIQSLAAATEATLSGAAIAAGTQQHNVGLTISVGSGWGSLDYSWQARNGWTMLTVVVARVGSPITGGSTGNIANSVLATLTSNRPRIRVPAGATHAESGAATVSLFTDGSINLYAIGAGATVGVGDAIRTYFVYPS